jgi:hypothetical protein
MSGSAAADKARPNQDCLTCLPNPADERSSQDRQSYFGNSMRERESRKKNLLHTANQWVDAVSAWLARARPEDVATVFELDRTVSQVESCRIFVIGRNFAHFSGPGEPDSRAA